MDERLPTRQPGSIAALVLPKGNTKEAIAAIVQKLNEVIEKLNAMNQ